MFQGMVERMTNELTALVPSTMRPRWLLHRQNIIIVGAFRFHCAEVFLQPSLYAVSSGGTTMFHEFVERPFCPAIATTTDLVLVPTCIHLYPKKNKNKQCNWW